MKINNVLELIGNTPIIKLSNIAFEDGADIYVKLEKYNAGGSIKDRAALGMIEDAEKRGILKKGDIIVEPTSGNTGISLAMIGRLKGYKVIIVMPETMSQERRSMVKAYGAELILTEGSKGMKGAIEKATELQSELENVFIPQQFSNKANPLKHYETTANEIINDLDGKLDLFVAGVGTGGTISGIGKRLKEFNEDIEVVAVEPSASPVISGGEAGPHKIQGIGAGFIPEIYEKRVVDRVMTIENEEAFEMVKTIAEKEGLLLGVSSGANILAALRLSKELGKGKTVVTVAPDGVEKYISMGIF